MRGLDYYYAEIQRELCEFDMSIGQEFKFYAEKHSPREVFLWLEQRRINGHLPLSVSDLITEFYWDVL